MVKVGTYIGKYLREYVGTDPGGGGPGGDFSPTDLPQLVAWWDGSDLTTMAVNADGSGGNPALGGSFQYWEDKVGGKTLATNGTDNCTADEFGVAFELGASFSMRGSFGNMTTADFTDMLAANPQGGVFAAYRCDQTGDFVPLATNRGSNGLAGFSILHDISANESEANMVEAAAGAYKYLGDGVVTPGQRVTHLIQHTGVDTGISRVNGVSAAQTLVGGPWTGGTAHNDAFFAWAPAGSGFGRVEHLMIFDAELTTEQIEQLEAWAGNPTGFDPQSFSPFHWYDFTGASVVENGAAPGTVLSVTDKGTDGIDLGPRGTVNIAGDYVETLANSSLESTLVAGDTLNTTINQFMEGTIIVRARVGSNSNTLLDTGTQNVGVRDGVSIQEGQVRFNGAIDQVDTWAAMGITSNLNRGLAEGEWTDIMIVMQGDGLPALVYVDDESGQTTFNLAPKLTTPVTQNGLSVGGADGLTSVLVADVQHVLITTEQLTADDFAAWRSYRARV
jgi:hypothetical protein